MFVYAPDTRIKVHPIRIAACDWPSVIGEMDHQPLPTQHGNTIAPTGKAFKIVMCTVGPWKDSVMDEEYRDALRTVGNVSGALPPPLSQLPFEPCNALACSCFDGSFSDFRRLDFWWADTLILVGFGDR
jgi:hypothetical protein